MNNTQIISLTGAGLELPKYIAEFSTGATMLSNNIDEILEVAKKEKREIKSINPVKIDSDIFTSTINLIDETKALLNTFFYAVEAEDMYDEDYKTKFFSFFEMIKSIEEKVREMKELYQNNYEMIEIAERLAERNKVA